MTNRKLLGHFTIALALPMSLLLFASCSETVAPSPSVVETASETAALAAPRGVGFLSDYSKLKPGREGQPQWIYVNPQGQWSNYTDLMIDPVTFIASAGSDVSADNQKTLADYFYNQLKEQLSKTATIVNEPGPGVLRLRVALTNAEGATPGLRSISVVVPQARLLNMAKSAATGSYAFVGSASCEGSVTDSVTGEQLAAWIDTRKGGIALKSAAQWKWGDAESVMKYWAEKLADRYVELTSGKSAS